MMTASPSPERRDTSKPAAREDLVSLLGKRKSKEDCRLEANIEVAIFADMLNTTLQNTIAAAVVHGTCNDFTTRGQLLAREAQSTLETTADIVADLSDQAFQDHQHTLSTTERSICALARDMIDYGLDLDDISPPSANSFDPNAVSAHHVCPYCCVRTSIIDHEADAEVFGGPNDSRWGRHLRLCPDFRGERQLEALPPPRHVASGSPRPLPLAPPGEAASTGAAATADAAPLAPRPDETVPLNLTLQLHSSVGQRENDATSRSLRNKLESREQTLHDTIIEILGEMSMLYDHTYHSTKPEIRCAIDDVLKARQALELYVSGKPPSLHSTAAVIAMKDLVFADAASNTDFRLTTTSSTEASGSVASRLGWPSNESEGGPAGPPPPPPSCESHRPNAPEDPSPAKCSRRPTPQAPPAPPPTAATSDDHGAPVLHGSARHEHPKPSGPRAAGATLCIPLPPGTTLNRTGSVHAALLHTLYVQAAGANRKELLRHLSKLTLHGSSNSVNGRIDSLIHNGWAHLNTAGNYTMHPLARAYFATENSRSSRDDLESTLRTEATRTLRDVEDNNDTRHKHIPSPGMPPPPRPPPPATPAVAPPRGRWVPCKCCKKDVWLDELAMTWDHHKPICRLERLTGSILQAVKHRHADARWVHHGSPVEPLRVLATTILNDSEPFGDTEFNSALQGLVTSRQVQGFSVAHSPDTFYAPSNATRNDGDRRRRYNDSLNDTTTPTRRCSSCRQPVNWVPTESDSKQWKEHNRTCPARAPLAPGGRHPTPPLRLLNAPRPRARDPRPDASASPRNKRQDVGPAAPGQPRADTAESLHTQHLQALARGEPSTSVRERLLQIIFAITEVDQRGATLEEIQAGLRNPVIAPNITVDTVADLMAHGILQWLPHLVSTRGSATETRYLITSGYDHVADPMGNLGEMAPARRAIPHRDLHGALPASPAPAPAPPLGRPALSRGVQAPVALRRQELAASAAPARTPFDPDAIRSAFLATLHAQRCENPYGCPHKELFSKVYAHLINARQPGELNILERSSNAQVTDGEIARAAYEVIEATFDNPTHNNIGLTLTTILQRVHSLLHVNTRRDNLERVLQTTLDDRTLSNLLADVPGHVHYAPYGAQPGDHPHKHLRGTRGEEHMGMITANPAGDGCGTDLRGARAHPSSDGTSGKLAGNCDGDLRGVGGAVGGRLTGAPALHSVGLAPWSLPGCSAWVCSGACATGVVGTTERVRAP
ncbi:hypothetical protein T484DRAFT_1848212 [Baffinella frigidus]|nr:hypothetical protein T484DRAFT_1848212 [Cryptophyta sp. CCMP2293]